LRKQMDRRSRFLLTKTEPQICWTPSLSDPKLTATFAECKAKVDSKRAQWAQTFEQEAAAVTEYFATKRKDKVV